MRKKQTLRPVVTGVCVCMLALLAGSCSEPPGGMGKSPVFLTAENGEDLWALWFDVYNSALPGGVGDEMFQITIKSNYKNPDLTSSYADVVIQEYHVSYYRPDGKQPVPAPFMLQLTSTVPAGESKTINTLVLRRDAKLRSPLKELVLGGGEGYIDLVAVIDFYGEDLMGNNHHVRYHLSMLASDM